MQRTEQNNKLFNAPDTPTAEHKGIPLVYAWGRNEDGELGITTTNFTSQPSPIRGFRGVVNQIASARTHTAILNTDGQIYMAGSGLFGKIGIMSTGNNFKNLKEFKQQKMDDREVKKVAVGDFHTLALTEEGDLYSWGGSLWDKTGHKGGGILKIERLAGHRIVEIACGDYHSLALTAQGQVYSWGGGGQNKNRGQLGHSNKKDYPHPELIQFFKGKSVKKIACGDYHTMVLTNQEQLFAFGEGSVGQLGTGGQEESPTPKKVALKFQTNLEQFSTFAPKQKIRIEQLGLGGRHSLILTNKGQLYVCGCGGQGQLGLGVAQNKYEPVLVQSLLGKHIKMVAAGFNHSLCLADKGDIFSCGFNSKGQLGLAADKFAINWTHVKEMQGIRVAKIFAGGDHSWCVLDQTQPYIDDYEPPSPIKPNLQAIGPPKSVETPRRKIQQPLLNPATNKKLQLIITQVELSHKLIHFVFKDKLIKNSQFEINSYIDQVRKIQGKNLRFSKVNPDGQIYDINGQLIFSGNPKGMTILLISELPQDANEYVVFRPDKQIAIGDVIMMDSNMLQVEGTIPSHNMWFFIFLRMFESELEKVRFVELRPKIY